MTHVELKGAFLVNSELTELRCKNPGRGRSDLPWTLAFSIASRLAQLISDARIPAVSTALATFLLLYSVASPSSRQRASLGGRFDGFAQ